MALNTAYRWDVSSLIKGNGPVSMYMSSPNCDGARYRPKDADAGAAAPGRLRSADGGQVGALDARRAEGDGTSAAQVDLSWTASTDNKAVTGYGV